MNKNIKNLEYELHFQRANEKFRKGDEAITDAELKMLLDFYQDLKFKLSLMGERHHFAWRDAYDNAQRLKDFHKARTQL